MAVGTLTSLCFVPTILFPGVWLTGTCGMSHRVPFYSLSLICVAFEMHLPFPKACGPTVEKLAIIKEMALFIVRCSE